MHRPLFHRVASRPPRAVPTALPALSAFALALTLVGASFGALLTPRVAVADAHEAAKEASMPSPEELVEQVSTTKDSVRIDGVQVDYTATVGDLILRDDDGMPIAKMVYVSYVRDGVGDPARRPVTFAFNGGPGSASVWVHLGAFGPKKAKLDDEGWPLGPPPGELVDNDLSVLDATDLVFVDPVATGWSRPLPVPEGEEEPGFFGFSDDVAHISEFIRLWISRNDRWTSPKFIAGESYGTTRAAGLAQFLQDRYGMYLNGIALISSVLNWQTKVFNVGNDLPYVTILPTYTATAWYHGKLDPKYDDLDAALRESERFALEEFGPALMLGERLPAERRAHLVTRLAELSGLSEEYIESADLRVEIYRYVKELLRDEGTTVGRIDSRYVGADLDDAGENFDYDPFFTVGSGWYVSLMKDYLRRQLGYRTDVNFRQSAGAFVRPWNYHESSRTQGYGTNAYANYAETLRDAMHKNPYLKVLVMSGYYDLATPYFATDYTVEHMQLDPRVRGNIEVAYYESGHMMYIRRADHEKFRRDYLRLIEQASIAVEFPFPDARRAVQSGE